MVKTSPSSARCTGSIPGQEQRSHVPCDQKNQDIKQKQYCSRFNKDCKNGLHPKKKVKIYAYSIN